MKKFILILASAYIAAATPASGFVITSTALAGVAVTLAPIITPIAISMLEKAENEIHNLITEGTCPLNCKMGLPLSCGTKTGLSVCKKVCQKTSQVGGYEIKIRFGKDWSLAECVKKRVLSGKNTSQGKGNTTSIAVYSQEDLNNLVSLIGLKMAARQIVDTNGAGLNPKELRKAKKTKEEAVKEAKDLVEHITESIKKNVNEGIYGNQ